jgi:hypothetical protein
VRLLRLADLQGVDLGTRRITDISQLEEKSRSMQFDFCGRRLHFIPSVRHGVSSDGRVLTAGHCSEHGWVGSDKKGPVVLVTPEKNIDR